MPRKPPAEPIDHHYNIPKLHKALFATGAVLTAVFLLMVWADYDRPWKTMQRMFLRIDARQTREAALAARQKAFGEERQKLMADLGAARQQVRAHQAELDRLNRKMSDLAPKIYAADQNAKFAKASFDAALYTYESSLATKPKAAPAARAVRDRIDKELNAANMKLAELKRQESETQAEINQITSRRDDARVAIEKLTADYRLDRNKLESLKQDALFALRNSPILDMVNPSLRVQQVQLPELYNDVNFMKIPKVDRCQTCHIAADRTGFEDTKLNAVFRTHPRLSLMVGSESPHSVGNFGCTSCHGGRDRASSFWSAGHSPQDTAQEKRWEHRFEWEFDRFNDTPVLPMKYAEAGCYRCHTSEANFPEVPTLDGGMRMVETLGCWGCHRITGIEAQKLPRPGPSLEKIAAKAPKEWALRWVTNPAAFRASTRMPTFFYQENYVNVSGSRPPTAAQVKMNEQGRIENDAMVNSIVAYLYDRSKPGVVQPAEGHGDSARGEKLLASRGCYGCHMNDPGAERDLVGTYRQFGPNLAGVGGKASRDWIFRWILNPKDWNPDTKMPNLRLSREDALDIAEYLSASKAPADFAKAPLPTTDPETLQRIGLYFEMGTKTIFDAKADLAAMDLHAKEVYVGRNLIAQYGCFACHAIPGFEDAKPIGTELTEEGSKPVHRLDFGFLHLPHTRQDWFRTKLANPRVFDRDRARGWEEKLRMPNFRFSPRELDYVVTAVLGFQKLNASEAAVKRLSPAEEAIEHGRRIVKDHNCQGCHIIEGVGGSIRSIMADVSLAPPIIQGQGAKVQSDWLFGFLKAPKTGQIRPWLEVHMPTFGFSERELNDLTKYFAALDRATYPFLSADYATDPRSWAAGKKLFELLRCAQCHPRSVEDMNRPGVDRATLAPNLQMAATRLRHDWINDWVRRPDEWMPGTRMPTNFPKGEDGKRTSPMAALVDAPSFAKDRAEFARILGSDAEVKGFLSDPDAVTRALRDYVWSIGKNGGTAPAPGPPAPGSAAAAGGGAP